MQSLSCTVFCFCFNQHTAFEMRISDWSSDVCSSDLRGPFVATPSSPQRLQRQGARVLHLLQREGRLDGGDVVDACQLGLQKALVGGEVARRDPQQVVAGAGHQVALQHLGIGADLGLEAVERSEEHTSELQSLMRISYAVFCL